MCLAGSGVFAIKPIRKGTLLLEYKGEMLEEDPLLKNIDDTYVYEFKFNGQHKWWVFIKNMYVNFAANTGIIFAGH